MNDISVFGLRVNLIASETFPSGIVLTQFADDADPFDSPSTQIRDKAMGANGDMITWGKANPIPLTINLIPGSEDDENMGVLLEANRVAKGKFGARDVITINVQYPDGRSRNFSQGVITDGILADSAASSGRLKSKPYAFAFENMSRS